MENTIEIGLWTELACKVTKKAPNSLIDFAVLSPLLAALAMHQRRLVLPFSRCFGPGSSFFSGAHHIGN